AAAADALVLDYLNITDLAFIFACADLSYKMEAAPPAINTKRVVKLDRARHPLLDRKTVVPITVTLGEGFNMLVITGPNTGGKTVTLKTIGLFALMAQSGLHIPAEDTSSICVFDEIFSDIGDEQSIEQSLSTFSSHMKGIVSIVERMTKDSLVLFDELGSGTDPVEGAALAMSILEEVRLEGALCAATTHYAELKAYALETEGVANASCEFDVNTLKPTYKLIIGTPGKSNAFAISEKLGLSPVLVQRAKRYVDSGSRSFEAVIEKLEATRTELEREHAETVRLKKEFEEYKAKKEAELQRRIGSAEKDSAKMLAKAQEILDGARATGEFVFAQLDEIKKERDAKDLAEKLAAAKRTVRQRVRDYDNVVNPVDLVDDDDYVLPRPLKKGDAIYHRNLGVKGYLLDDPDKKGNVNLKLGAVKSKANISDLRLLEGEDLSPEKQAAKSRANYRATVSKNFKLDCDVRGMTGEEAWFVVDKYIDEANVAGIKTCTIIHGKGTGALRAALWARFKADSRVKRFRAGEYGEGDYGVTVLEL
ncbi:MAG: endonuclease MutS2, partial [Ruminococcaceae bacterium]|nr:endonuclease MutS2 [Oscillospiraceae bacterium]